jgi:hypothetical protein
VNKKFDRWIDELREEVVQGEYGYEPGEFTIYPNEWLASFKEGLTPSAAFKRALDAFAEARREDDRLKAENWKRIQTADAAAVSHTRSQG